MSSELFLAVAGNAAGAGEATYVEDVFSTYLYTGNGSSQVIENEINLGTSNSGGSVEFDGSGDRLIVGTDTSLDLTGDFTIEFWANLNTFNNYNIFFDTSSNGGAGPNMTEFWVTDTGTLQYYPQGSILLSTAANVISTNEWSHIAIVKNGTAQAIYVNGVSVASTTSSTQPNTGYNWHIGDRVSGAASGNYPINGNMSNFRIVKGTALYTSAFTPSTTALTAVSGTSLLTCQGDTPLVDNSSNAHTITVNGDATAKAFGPFTSDTEGKGGLVWIKDRDDTYGHYWFDTERGAGKNILSNTTSAEATDTNKLSSFNSNGFSLGTNVAVSTSGDDYVSWTFRKAPKFFDVVTYTGDGTSSRAINHNLGSTPGCVIVKCTSSAHEWPVYHRGLSTSPSQHVVFLHLTQQEYTVASRVYGAVNSVADDTFTVVSGATDNRNVNKLNETYVAYLFAHNDGDGDFGETGDQDIIKCGTYTGTGSAGNSVDIGFEPQFFIHKAATTSAGWYIHDNMRGLTHTGYDWLEAQSSAAETNGSGGIVRAEANGVSIHSTGGGFNSSGQTYIYIAIRRGPMKTPESGTDVFAMDQLGQTSPTPPGYNSPFPVDLGIQKGTVASSWSWTTRLLDGGFLKSDSTAAYTASSQWVMDFQNGFRDTTATSTDYYGYMFRRAPGFFDVVAYEGDGPGSSANENQVEHNLTVKPDLVIVKRRDSTGDWWTFTDVINGSNDYGYLNSSQVFGNSANNVATSSVFNVGGVLNTSGADYIAYLFATLPGISKVGSYTGNGTSTGDSQVIDCGFSAGARFVLIKRTDLDKDWWVMDTERGIVAGDDKLLRLNLTNSELSGDIINPNSSGFEVEWRYGPTDGANINASGASYIFLAIA